MNTYIGPKYLLWGAPAVQVTSPDSQDSAKQLFLWKESERIVNLSFFESSHSS